MPPLVRRGWALALAFAACSSEPTPGGECSVSKDCVLGEICVGGTCVVKVEAPSCDGDEDCNLDERCDDTIGECVSLTTPVDASITDVPTDAARPDARPDGGPLDTGRRDMGFITDLGLSDADLDGAVPPPDSGVDGGPIDTGVIIPDSGAPDVGSPDSGIVPGTIALGGDCVVDPDCASNVCLSLTIAAVSRSVCSSACGATNQCPLDFNCNDVSGMNFCLGEDLTVPPGTYDIASGGPCSSTVNSCQSTWCNTGTGMCIESCSRNADCGAFGGQCFMYTQVGTPTTYDHLCFSAGGPSPTGAACTLDANCTSGICNRYNASCAAHCCGDTDCPSNQSCAAYDLDATNLVKVCVPRAATAGNAVLGAACTSPGDCESEICLAVDPTNAGSPRKCSTLCCFDNDCSALPAGGRCLPIPGTLPNTILGACRPF